MYGTLAPGQPNHHELADLDGRWFAGHVRGRLGYRRVGALRFAFEIDIAGLRHLGLARFPFAVLYIETTDEIDVWRILHTRRDLPSGLADPRRPFLEECGELDG